MCHLLSQMQSNDNQMTSHEKRRFKIPEYARVFWNQAPMMQSASDTDLMITYDKDEIGRKAYALYDDPAAFYKDILTSNRNAYELIQENKPCPLNMDVEWYGLEDVSREQIGCIIHELRDYCLQKLTRNIDINVVKSSRFDSAYKLRLLHGKLRLELLTCTPRATKPDSQVEDSKIHTIWFRPLLFSTIITMEQ